MNYHMTQFEINKRCAELLGLNFAVGDFGAGICTMDIDTEEYFEPTIEWKACGHIIEKCWDGLMVNNFGETIWEYIIDKYNCTKLEAACIYYIETYGEN